jgi:hypothetical protein
LGKPWAWSRVFLKSCQTTFVLADSVIFSAKSAKIAKKNKKLRALPRHRPPGQVCGLCAAGLPENVTILDGSQNKRTFCVNDAEAANPCHLKNGLNSPFFLYANYSFVGWIVILKC